MAVSLACIGDNCIDRYLGSTAVARSAGMRSTSPWGSPGQASRPPTSGQSETTPTGPPWWPD